MTTRTADASQAPEGVPGLAVNHDTRSDFSVIRTTAEVHPVPVNNSSRNHHGGHSGQTLGHRHLPAPTSPGLDSRLTLSSSGPHYSYHRWFRPSHGQDRGSNGPDLDLALNNGSDLLPQRSNNCLQWSRGCPQVGEAQHFNQKPVRSGPRSEASTVARSRSSKVTAERGGHEKNQPLGAPFSHSHRSSRGHGVARAVEDLRASSDELTSGDLDLEVKELQGEEGDNSCPPTVNVAFVDDFIDHHRQEENSSCSVSVDMQEESLSIAVTTSEAVPGGAQPYEDGLNLCTPRTPSRNSASLSNRFVCPSLKGTFFPKVFPCPTEILSPILSLHPPENIGKFSSFLQIEFCVFFSTEIRPCNSHNQGARSQSDSGDLRSLGPTVIINAS